MVRWSFITSPTAPTATVTDDPLTLPEVMAALGAELILASCPPDWSPCPECGRMTPPSLGGRRAYCPVCTAAELGFGAYDLAVCRAHGISMKRWLEVGDEAALPPMTYRAWRKRTGR